MFFFIMARAICRSASLNTLGGCGKGVEVEVALAASCETGGKVLGALGALAGASGAGTSVEPETSMAAI
jgi:hypothetical protein